MIEVKKLVGDRHSHLLARVAREDLRAEAQSVGHAVFVINRPHCSVEPIQARRDIDVLLLRIVAEARLEQDYDFDERAGPNIGDRVVEFAKRIYLARHADQKFIQHRSPERRIRRSVNGPIEIVTMLVLDQPLPQPALRTRRFVFGLIPEDKEVVDYVYDVMTLEESFEDEPISRRLLPG